jgi:hypothetical protein
VSFDPAQIEPRPSDWLQLNVEYSGEGRAEFADPKGSITGPTTIRFDEFGRASAEMDAGDPECERELRCGWPEFVRGGRPVEHGDRRRIGISDEQNTCIVLSVRTPKGGFATVGTVLYVAPLLDKGRITFHLGRSLFNGANAGVPKYWVLPLFNFVSAFGPGVEELERHPLRLYRTPAIPDGVGEQDRAVATLYANRRNRLIVFEFQGQHGFIELLPDYEKREARLRKERERRLVTAVMVGAIGPNSIEADALDSWFPFDFLEVLGVATGVEVGAPWIEFRDERGQLVRRYHAALRSRVFIQGHRAINEDVTRGTGRLLTRAHASPHFGKTYLRVAMQHLIEASSESLVEERVAHVCRGLDGLCAKYELTGRNLRKGMREPYKRRVKCILEKAADEIRSQAAAARNCGDGEDAAVLEEIAKRTVSNPYVESNFGSGTVRLLQEFGLPDGAIMACYHGRDPEEGLRRWAQWLSECRNTPSHGRYFEIVGGRHDLGRLLQTSRHLLDILVRIVLKMLCYEGTYQPTTSVLTDRQPLDWVTPDLPASRLGYSMCSFCQYLGKWNFAAEAQTCSAFPDRIPDEIWNGRNKHVEPYPGDHGIRFEPRPEVSLDALQREGLG